MHLGIRPYERYHTYSAYLPANIVADAKAPKLKHARKLVQLVQRNAAEEGQLFEVDLGRRVRIGCGRGRGSRRAANAETERGLRRTRFDERSVLFAREREHDGGLERHDRHGLNLIVAQRRVAKPEERRSVTRGREKQNTNV